MTNLSAESIGATQQPRPGAPDNWRRFFSFSTDHKVIGIQYIVTSFFFFLVGGLLAMIMRGELITPDADLIDAVSMDVPGAGGAR
jgi:cytochrome c oxidase subunit 1